MKYEIITASKRFSHPSSTPISAPIRRSPPPIHVPFEIRNCKKKNTKTARPPISIVSGEIMLNTIPPAIAMAIAGSEKRSGISLYFRS